jgi:hypothetical protein
LIPLAHASIMSKSGRFKASGLVSDVVISILSVLRIASAEYPR